MAKTKLSEYDANAANNLDIDSINLSENVMVPSDVNNALRELMAHLKDFSDGTEAVTSPQMGSLTVGDSHTIGDDADDNLEIASSTAENIVIDSAGGTTLFKENGTEVARLTGGSLGIGSSSPSEQLQLTNSAGRVSIFMSSGLTNQGYISYFNATQTLSLGNASPTGTGANGGQQLNIKNTGTVLVGINNETDTPTYGAVYINGDRSVGSTNDYPQIFVPHNSSYNHGIVIKELGSSGNAIRFLNSSGTVVGFVSTSASATTYNTSSDYRLKENVTDMTGATERLKQLNPVRFNFIADADTTVDGFLAHEVQDVVPEAVTGTHNQVQVWTQEQIDAGEAPENTSAGDNKLDDDGNTIPVYQGIDQSKLVPLLVATIQELEARISALEAN